MGTWGHGSFENDHASDWCSKLRGSLQPADFVLAALSTRHTEADEERLLAAAEIVAAAARGAAASDIPQDVVAWLAEGRVKVDPNLRELALTAVEAVREKSGLRHLWAEAGELDEWLTAVDDLLKRLRTLP
jgi:hypothetical protein